MKTHIFIKDQIKDLKNFNDVQKIFNELASFMQTKDVFEAINRTHKIGAKSTEIQEILNSKLLELGFKSEKKGLFKQYSSSNLRPDFYKKISENDGVIIEVERGKTLDNNMDLLDIWKCHICKEANYLFLIIPEFKTNLRGTQQKIYERTLKRISTFFDEQNYINVNAVFLVGY